MSQVVERLRKSKQALGKQERVAGLEDGRRWAEEKADYKELVALENLIDGIEDSPTDLLDQNSVLKMFQSLQINPSYVSDWWGEAIEGTRQLSDDYVEAFTEAALGVFNSVKDRL